jgi:hypothetical protein
MLAVFDFRLNVPTRVLTIRNWKNSTRRLKRSRPIVRRSRTPSMER